MCQGRVVLSPDVLVGAILGVVVVVVPCHWLVVVVALHLVACRVVSWSHDRVAVETVVVLVGIVVAPPLVIVAAAHRLVVVVVPCHWMVVVVAPHLVTCRVVICRHHLVSLLLLVIIVGIVVARPLVFLAVAPASSTHL